MRPPAPAHCAGYRRLWRSEGRRCFRHVDRLEHRVAGYALCGAQLDQDVESPPLCALGNMRAVAEVPVGTRRSGMRVAPTERLVLHAGSALWIPATELPAELEALNGFGRYALDVDIHVQLITAVLCEIRASMHVLQLSEREMKSVYGRSTLIDATLLCRGEGGLHHVEEAQSDDDHCEHYAPGLLEPGSEATCSERHFNTSRIDRIEWEFSRQTLLGLFSIIS